MLLEVNSVTKKFGGLNALSDISFSIDRGELIGLIGPNGAGKTTLFNCITGVLNTSSGTIHFDNNLISGKKAFQIARAGIARSYQIVQPFGNMTTLQNAMVGGFCNTNNYKKAEDIAMNALKLVNLDHKKDVAAHTLNLGERKKLEVAKALSVEPKLLLLDEVMAGLTIQEVQEMVKIIESINKSGVTIMVIEHIMEAIMSLSKRVVVMNFGKKIAEGSPLEIKDNKQVVEAYLGSENEE